MLILMTLAALSTPALADDSSVHMDLVIRCSGPKCDDIKIADTAVENDTIVPLDVDTADDGLVHPVIMTVDGISFAIEVEAGQHVVRIQTNDGLSPRVSSDTVVTQKVGRDFSMPNPGDVVPSGSYVVAQCDFENARIHPEITGTNDWVWTIEDEANGGCRWINPGWRQIVTLPGATLTAHWGQDYTGDDDGNWTGRMDTNTQARPDESGQRADYIVAWFEANATGIDVKELMITVAPGPTLSGTKTAQIVVTFDARIIMPPPPPPPIIPEPCHISGMPYSRAFPVDLSTDPPRKVAGDRNYDGVYDAQDCEVLQDIPVVRKFRWELHGVLGVATDQFSLNVGPGIFIPVGEAQWIRLWGNVGITPDRTTTLPDIEQGSLFDLMQFGVTHPVATWGVGGTWIGAKGLSLGVTGNGYRTSIYGNSDIYDLRAVGGYTHVGDNHWSWYIVGGPSYEWGHAPAGQEVWAFGQFTKGPTAFRTFGFGAEGGLMYVF